jgi:hypothetical protein
MKLRIKGSSVRLRVPPEVSRLIETGSIEERVYFSLHICFEIRIGLVEGATAI